MAEEMYARELRALQTKLEDERSLTPATKPHTFETADLLIARLVGSSKRALAAREAAAKVKEPVKFVVLGNEPGRVSLARLEDLKRIDLSEMALRRSYSGRYLLVRVLGAPALTPPLALTIVLAVASPSGQATLLHLHNYPILPPSLSRPTEDDIDATFPVGSLLAIKEPRVATDLLTGEIGVKVDSPGDVILLGRGRQHDIVKDVQWTLNTGSGEWNVPGEDEQTLDQWKSRGNKHFAAKRFLSAVSAYSRGIAQHHDSPSLHLLFLNRAQLYIRLEKFSSALADAESALALIIPLPADSSDRASLLEKALARKSKALYSLRRWPAALAAYEALLAVSPSLPDARDGIAACRARLSEAESASYDFTALYKTALAFPEGGAARMVDAANYVGPVKVASIKDKGGGRGLVATRDIQDGEILLAVKAIALVSVTEVPSSRPIVAFNLEEGVVDTSNLVLYTQSVLYRLMDQPELAPKVYDLYLGPNSPAETPADFPLAPIEGQPPAIDVTAPCRLDPDAIARAAYWNASTPFRVLPVPVSGDLLTYGSEETPGALYAESAMINHSCLWNAFHCYWGDFQITKAATFISAGEEILASYVPDLPLEFRQPRLQKFFGTCACPLCKADTIQPPSSSPLPNRSSLIVKILREEDPASSASIAQLEAALKRRRALLAEIEETYDPSRTLPRPDALFGIESVRLPLLLLAAKRDWKKAKDLRSAMANELRGLQLIGVKLFEEAGEKKGAGVAGPKVLSPARYRQPEATRGMILLAGLERRLALVQQGEGKEKAEEEGEKRAKAWVREAEKCEDETVGGGWKLFVERWKAVLEEAGVMDLAME